jgi:hypothetical protein
MVYKNYSVIYILQHRQAIAPQVWNYPFTCPTYLALEMMIAIMWGTMLNNMGNRGSPCLNPFLVWKYEPILSFTFIPTFPHWVNASTHLHYVLEKPFIRKVWCKKSHFTLLYTFSNLFKNHSILLCSSCIVSCKNDCPFWYASSTKECSLWWSNYLLIHICV